MTASMQIAHLVLTQQKHLRHVLFERTPPLHGLQGKVERWFFEQNDRSMGSALEGFRVTSTVLFPDWGDRLHGKRRDEQAFDTVWV